MRYRPVRSLAAIFAVSLVITLAGCAGPAKTSKGPVFFPPAPNLPRLQYLTGINDSSDVEKDTDGFSLFSPANAAKKKAIPIVKPCGIAASRGKVYIADIAGQIVVLDLPRKSFELLKGNHGIGKLKKPAGIAIDDLGFIYVADVGRKELVVYDQEGEFLKTVGSELGIAPTDVAVDNDRIYILDTKGAVIKALDRTTGAFVMDIGKKFAGENGLSLPINFTLDKKGVFHVTNAGNGKIVSCDRDGNFIGSFGQMGDGFGQFSRPRGIAVDDKGEVFVVDAGFSNAQIFNDKGRLLAYFGSEKLPLGGMNLPAGITLSNTDLPYYQTLADKNFEMEQIVFVANQFGDPKISVYGFGKRKGVDYEKEYARLQVERVNKARVAVEKAREKAQQQEQKDAVKPEALNPSSTQPSSK